MKQAALSVVKQAVEELQDARMPPDHAQRLSDLDGRAFPQLRQALHQLAGLGRAERADGDLMEVGLHARDGVAAGKEQSATRRVLGQLSEKPADVGVEEGTAAHGEVLLEAVEHQHYGIFGQGLAEEMEVCSVVEVSRQQQGGLLLQLVAFGLMEACSVVEVSRQQQGGLLLQLVAFGLEEHRAQAGGDRPQVEATRVCGHPPAVLLEPLHHAPGHRALAHAAEPGEDDASMARAGSRKLRRVSRNSRRRPISSSMRSCGTGPATSYTGCSRSASVTKEKSASGTSSPATYNAAVAYSGCVSAGGA